MAEDTKPVKLKDLIQSLASTMVVTTRYLDQATVDLQNVYATGSESLAALTPPRFTIDEVTVDLSFVVEEAAVVPDGFEPAAAKPVVVMTATQRQTLLTRLQELHRYEQELLEHQRALAAWTARQQQLQSERNQLRRDSSQLDATLRSLPAQIAAFEAQARTFDALPFGSGKSQAAAFRAQSQKLKVQQQAMTAKLKQLRSREAAVSSERQKLGARPQAPKKPAAVQAGTKARRGPDYAALWRSYEAAYSELKAVYLAVVAAFEAGKPLPKIRRFDPLPGVAKDAMARAGVTPTVLGRVKAVEGDYENTKRELGKVAGQVAKLQGEGIRVRVDPEGISSAGETALQRLQLTFRAESQETVKVEGKDVDIAR